MNEFICVVCGKKGEARHGDKMYCSNRCNAIAFRRRHSNDTEQLCRFNEGVTCNGGDCSSCGWNPEIADQRMDMAMRRLGYA